MDIKKITYCTASFLEEFKTNFDQYLPMYLNKDKEKLKLLFNNENVLQSNIEFKYEDMKTSDNSDNSDRDNIKIIYKSLKDLTPVQASQEELWVAMYNTYYINHLFNYIDLNKQYKDIERKIQSSILFMWGNKRSLIVQNLSRMWWLGYYLYDEENKDNPYELLDFYTDTKDIVGKSTTFFSSNITSNKNLRYGIIDGIKELVDKGLISNTRKYYVETTKYFNIVGSIRVLDFMQREEVKYETIKYIKENLIK